VASASQGFNFTPAQAFGRFLHQLLAIFPPELALFGSTLAWAAALAAIAFVTVAGAVRRASGIH
jgi:hypothetical protein